MLLCPVYDPGQKQAKLHGRKLQFVTSLSVALAETVDSNDNNNRIGINSVS